jgi:AbrB family looped-hinge helix DNA binding protein
MPPFTNKIYGTTTMNEKGQIVIPAEARGELGLAAGSRLMVMRAPFGDVIIVVKTEVLEAQIQSWTESINKPIEESK